MTNLNRIAKYLYIKYANMLPPNGDYGYEDMFTNLHKDKPGKDWIKFLSDIEVDNAKQIAKREQYDEKINHIKRLFSHAATLKEKMNFDAAKEIYEDIVFLSQQYQKSGDPLHLKQLQYFCNNAEQSAKHELENLNDRNLLLNKDLNATTWRPR